ncbi:MAG: hypothetical protein IJB92_02590 [Clostridia bacterium]|nr:hypothetical protein [Clostridia bacterium]
MKNFHSSSKNIKGRTAWAILALVLLLTCVFAPAAYAQDTATVSAILYIGNEDSLFAALIAARDDEGGFSLLSLPVNTRGIVNIKKGADKTDAVYSTLYNAYLYGGSDQNEKIENVTASLSRIAGGIDIDEVYVFDSDTFSKTVEKCDGIDCDVSSIPGGLDFSYGGYSKIAGSDTSPHALWLKRDQMIKGASPSSLSVWKSLNGLGPRSVGSMVSENIILSGENAAKAMESIGNDAGLASTLISGILAHRSGEPTIPESELDFVFRSKNASLFDDIKTTDAHFITQNAFVISGRTRQNNDGSYFIPDTTALTDWVMKNIYLVKDN